MKKLTSFVKKCSRCLAVFAKKKPRNILNFTASYFGLLQTKPNFIIP